MEAFPTVDMAGDSVHAFGTGEVRVSVSKAGILAPTNFDNCLEGEQIQSPAAVDGQVSGIGDVLVEGSECAYRALNAWTN